MVTSCSPFRREVTKLRPMKRVPPITSTFMTTYPKLSLGVGLVVVFKTEVSNQILTPHPAKRVFQLHQLDEDIMLGIQTWSGHRRLEVERQPLLNAAHARAL